MPDASARHCPYCGHMLYVDREQYDATRLSVLMPVYNERDTLREIVRRVERIDIPKELVLVDDYSTDGTREVVSELAEAASDRLPFENSIRAVFHDENQGKGAALQTAIQEAQGDVIIIQDADLEYDPTDYFQVLHPILAGEADVVYGSRFQGVGPHRVLYFWHYLGNRFITFLSNMFTNLNLTDVETCYKAFRADVLKSIPIEQKRFGFEVEITSKVAQAECRIYEVGISYFGRTYTQGKKITWKDGVEALYLILKYR